MSKSTGVFKSEIESLSPEILLKIFLNLESHETVILRSVCKEFVEIIDNNKSLWRILEWKQSEEESPIPALEMFDEKSASALRGVSIFQKRGAADDRLLKVLDRSKNSLADLSLKIYSLKLTFRPKLMELASSSNILNTLVLWSSDKHSLSEFPRTLLTRSSRQTFLGTGRPRNLQVLWYFNLVQEWNEKLDVSSLVSFADPCYCDSLQLRSILSKSSSTLIHLSIAPDKGATLPPLSCPSLRILEGQFFDGFPSWLDSPNLQIFIASSIRDTSFLQELPISVEEFWLLSWFPSVTAERKCLDFLSQVCPQLKVVKLGRDLIEEKFEKENALKSFRARKEKVNEGVEIGGIKMMPLEKLILPIDLFNSAEIDQLRDLVGEVIDINDYPDFVEIEY